MKQLVVDAGPLIGLFYARDPLHSQCITGFEQLNTEKVLILAPIPIIFEVYKWLLQRTNPNQAQQALDTMLSQFFVVSIDRENLIELQTLVGNLSNWHGTSEDAVVIVTAFRYRCPVWTINYRDFSAFKALEFWVPNSG